MTKKGRSYQKLVSFVAKAMDSNVKVKEEDWVEGPDGRRDRDVLVKGLVDGKNISILIVFQDG